QNLPPARHENRFGLRGHRSQSRGKKRGNYGIKYSQSIATKICSCHIVNPTLSLSPQSETWTRQFVEMRRSRMSNSCPILVPLASVAVFSLSPESRKYFILLRCDRFESYCAPPLTS